MITEKEIAFRLAYEEDIKLEASQHLNSLPPELYYHNASHTLQYVYPEAKRLAKMEGINEDEMLILVLISLFHDTGFSIKYSDNEGDGAQMAKDYAVNSNNVVLQDAAQIAYDAILNTNMKSRPRNRYEEIIRDADLSILGKQEFLEWNIRLRLEILNHPESGMYQLALDEKKWIESQLVFLKNHQWFTQSAKTLYQAQKEKNIQQLANQL